MESFVPDVTIHRYPGESVEGYISAFSIHLHLVDSNSASIADSEY